MQTPLPIASDRDIFAGYPVLKHAAVAGHIPEFLSDAGWASAESRALAGDASCRRYFRLTRTDGSGSAVLMVAPDPASDAVPFVAIDAILRNAGLAAPMILAARPEAGLLLLEDFGDNTFGALLQQGFDPMPLYELAVDALLAIHERIGPSQLDGLSLARYDAATFVQQAQLFPDVMWHLFTGDAPPRDVAKAFSARLSDALALVLAGCPQSLLMRDYHADNLMLRPGEAGLSACGILDFQMGGLGPVVYDLVSLLQDARRDVDPPLAAALVARWRAGVPALDDEAFSALWAVLGFVRHVRIVAIFQRLAQRDGKPAYLAHLPRVWAQLDGALAHPLLCSRSRRGLRRTSPRPGEAPRRR